MRRAAVITVLSMLAMAAAGCDTKPLQVTDPGKPADVPTADVPTADVPVADVPGDGTGDAPAADVLHDVVKPAEYVPAGSFRFRGAGRDKDAFRVEVVARDLPAMFGMALRVEWDPAALSLVSATPAALFGDEAAGEAVYRAAEVRPGSLALGLAHLYYLATTPLEGDVVVATLLLKPLDGRPADLAFFAPRCLVMDADRAAIEATYLPSTIMP